MLIAVNKVNLPNPQMKQAMIENFEKAIPAMKRFKGFLGMEIWTSADSTLTAVSRWESQEALDEYLNSPQFGHHHGGASSHTSDQATTYYTAKVLG